MTKKVIINNGDIIAFPLKKGGYGVGLVAHCYKRYIVSYFLNLKFNEIPIINMIKNDFNKKNVIYIKQHGSMGFRNNKWQIVGHLEGFTQNDWPIPEFNRKSELMSEVWYGISYDNTLSNTTERKITEEEAKNMPEDGFAGHEFIEIKMTKILENTIPR